jgi:succinoglycan biosynthesis transport protein ExoP
MTALTDQPLVQDARRYLTILHKRRGLLLTTVGLSLLVAVLYNYTTRPVYQASVQILIDKGQPKVLPGTQMVDPGLQDIQTEYELLRGRALAERVVESLELNRSPELLTGPMMSPWERFQRKFMGRAPAVAIDQDGLPLSPAAAAVRSRVSVEPLPGGRLVNLRFRAYDPGIAARAANALADLYIEQRQELRRETSSEATGWLSERVREQKAKLEEAERALLAYQERLGISNADARDGGTDVSALSSAALAARMERVAKETTLSQMRAAGTTQLASFPQIAASAGVQSARTRVSALQAEQARLGETLGDRHPDMVAVRNEIRQAEDKLHAEVRAALRAFESEVQSARAREAALSGNVQNARSDAMSVTRNSVELSTLQREVESNRQLYQVLIDRTKETGLESELKATNVRIVERAETPRAPFSPDHARNYQLALLIGLALGIGLTLLFENFDNTVRTPEDVKAMGLPFLGMIPAVPATAGSAPGTRPTALKHPEGPVAEAYRVVRTNLLFSSVQEGGRAIIFTSANPGEGKTTSAANVALSLAANGARVLVVDADLRRPTLHQHFAIPKIPGLSDVIVGKRQISEAIVMSRGKGLHVLPCGYIPPNPAELLGSRVMREIVAALKTRYDWVLIDTPPVLAMADTPVLCPHVDGVIVVVASEASSRPAVQRAIDQLASVGGTVIGAVLNKVDLKRNSYYYSQNYGEYYRSYYAEEEPRRAVSSGPRPIRRG